MCSIPQNVSYEIVHQNKIGHIKSICNVWLDPNPSFGGIIAPQVSAETVLSVVVAGGEKIADYYFVNFQEYFLMEKEKSSASPA